MFGCEAALSSVNVLVAFVPGTFSSCEEQLSGSNHCWLTWEGLGSHRQKLLVL